MEKGALDLLRAHLNVSWLRPESALWDTIASTLVCKHEILPPSLDLGCGNGIFSFLTAGGRFSIDYDWYINTATERFWKNNDIYDICKVDSLKEAIMEKPGKSFTVGLDHKPNLLEQAGLLGFYDRLVEHDAGQCLPFDKESFMTIFSNILYWLEDIKKPLSEIYRILKKDGTAVLCLPNVKFFEYCFTYKWEDRKSELLRLLNRGRSDCMHWAISLDDFSKIAKGIGFDVIGHSYYLSPLTLKMWDIGFRPLSPLLIKMANSLRVSDRKAIKQEWIDTLMSFCVPLYEMEIENKAEGGFHIFLLQK